MPSRGLWNRRFVGLVLTQFAGATNDNILKTVLLIQVAAGGTWAGVLGKGGPGIVNLLLTVPFVLLLGWAGQLADRMAKDRIIIGTRLLEVPIGLLALYGFLQDDPWVVLVAFTLLASESAFFNPAKYGCIPELVDRSLVAEANGFVNMSTNIAILLGVGIGGFLLSFQPHVVGIVIPAVALFGLLSSLLMWGLEPVSPNLERRLNPVGPYLDAIRSVRPGLVWNATLAWSWFYGAAIVVLAVIPEYRSILGLVEWQSSGLLASVGLGIGIGCVLAGRLSHGRIRGRFVVRGGLGTGLAFCLLGVLKPTDLGFTALCGTFLVAGISAGFFLIPLQAIQQLCTRPEERARVVATANAMSFLFMSLCSGAYSLAVQYTGLEPTRAIFGCGLLLLAICGWIGRGGGRGILVAVPGVPDRRSGTG